MYIASAVNDCKASAKQLWSISQHNKSLSIRVFIQTAQFFHAVVAKINLEKQAHTDTRSLEKTKWRKQIEQKVIQLSFHSQSNETLYLRN